MVVARTAISKGAALPTTIEVPVANDSAINSTEPVVDLSQWRSDTCTSGYRGVNWHKIRGKFEAWFDGRKQYLGAYDTAEEAAMVVARTTISKGAPLPEEKSSIFDSESNDADNPAQNEEQPTAPVVTKLSVPEPDIDLSQWRSDTCSSGYQGVYANKRKGTFEAWCRSSGGKQKYLGSYNTAEEAATVVAQTTISKVAALPTAVAIQITRTPEHNTVTPNAEVEAEDAPDTATQTAAADTLGNEQDDITKCQPTKPAPNDPQPNSDEWQCSGHPWINQRVLRLFGDQKVSGVVTGWIPASTAGFLQDLTADDPALFHVVHDDGECD